MKNKLLTHIATIVSLLAGSSLIHAQPIFSFDIEDNGAFGDTNVADISAVGTVDYGTPGEVNVAITNTSGAPYTSSVISGFYILRPTTNLGNPLDAALTSGPSNWQSDDDNFNLVLNFAPNVGNSDEYLFFGAEIPNQIETTGIQQGATGNFTFNLDALGVGEEINWNAYLTTDKPHILVRWQSLVGGPEGSAGGYGQFTPVPEPSQIAGLSVLALGGLLYIRRRVKMARGRRK